MNCVGFARELRYRHEFLMQEITLMVHYRRHHLPGGTWFFTVNLRNRRSYLLTSHITALKRAISDAQRTQPFTIDAWVVLPEHMHCIWTLPSDDGDFSQRWRMIKKSFTKALKMQDIWQPRFWEHTIRDEVDYRRHVDYCYFNPVKHGWVKSVNEWPFSSFHRDVRCGLYPDDWGGCVDTIDRGERR